MGQPMAHWQDVGKKVENVSMTNEGKTLIKMALEARF